MVGAPGPAHCSRALLGGIVRDADRAPARSLPVLLLLERRAEPPHVHVERDENRAKFWLDPVRLHESGGFRGAELNRVAALVGEHQALLLEAWREYFGE